MSVIIFALSIALSITLVAAVRRKKKNRFVKISAEQLPQTGSVNRYAFDKKLVDRTADGRFSRRECTMLRFRFRTEETGVSEAIVDLLIQHLTDWPIEQDFVLTKVAEDGFVVLVEDLALPDDVVKLEDQLRSYLDLTWGDEERDSPEFVLASASCPYDAKESQDLWGAVAKRLANREKIVDKNFISRPRITLLDNGVAVLKHAEGAGMNYAGFREAFQVYQDEIAPHYPGVKFPHLAISSGRIKDSDAKAASFMRSQMIVAMTSAIAVVPKNSFEKHVMRMFSYYNQPPYPFQIFETEDAAIEWLIQYVDPLYWEVKEGRQSA